MKTPITYYGGKQTMLKHILPLIPSHEIYTESFFGGGAVFFAKAPAKNEIINDKLGVVVNFYRCLKMRFSQLRKYIDSALLSRDIHKRMTLRLKRGPVRKYDIECAYAFWYCCNFSFSAKIGGGIKISNVRDVTEQRTMIHKKLRFTEELANRIEHTFIENKDALDVIKLRDTPNTFHFIDPPYFNADQGHYKGYTISDKIMLLDLLSTIEGKFILCTYDFQELNQYINDNAWNNLTFDMHLSAPMDNKNKRKQELLIANYTIAPNLFNQTN